MAKRKETCTICGIGSQEIHSKCWDCHYYEFDGKEENYIAKIGKDQLGRCDEKDCWICDSLKWESKRTRPQKHSKKQIIFLASGAKGKKNMKWAREELGRIKLREEKANNESERRKLERDKETSKKLDI